MLLVEERLSCSKLLGAHVAAVAVSLSLGRTSARDESL